MCLFGLDESLSPIWPGVVESSTNSSFVFRYGVPFLPRERSLVTFARMMQADTPGTLTQAIGDPRPAAAPVFHGRAIRVPRDAAGYAAWSTSGPSGSQAPDMSSFLEPGRPQPEKGSGKGGGK